jgi:hypothetical protein
MEEDMALADTEEIDDITFEDGGAVCVLSLIDDFEWNSSDERYSYFVRGHETTVMHDFVHMMFLTDKIRTCWIAIRDEDLFQEEADPAPDRFVIRVVSIFPPNERGAWFLPLLHYGCQWRGIGFEHSVSEDGEDLALRADVEAAKSAREIRLKRSDQGADECDAGSEDRELRAQRIAFKTDFPPEYWRWCGPDASEDDEGAKTGPAVSMATADVSKIVVTLHPPKVEVVIEDGLDWNDDEVFDPDEIATWTDELIWRHDISHMEYMWTRVRAILYLWRWKRIPDLEKKFQRGKLILTVVATYPPSDRGKWFYDWLRQFLSMQGYRFSLELSATAEAHALRQEAQRQRALRHAGEVLP